jgi:hypothetical protein
MIKPANRCAPFLEAEIYPLLEIVSSSPLVHPSIFEEVFITIPAYSLFYSS